jgi:adenylate cyclase
LPEKIHKKVRFPIGVKLVLVISALLISTLGAITVMVSVLVGSDVRIAAEDNNFTRNKRIAAGAEVFLQAVLIKARVQLGMSALVKGSEGPQSGMDFFFRENPAIAAVLSVANAPVVADTPDFAGAGRQRFVNGDFLAARGIDVRAVENFLQSCGEELKQAAAGEALLLNASSFFGMSALALIFLPDGKTLPEEPAAADAGEAPVPAGGMCGPVVCIFSAEGLAANFDSGANESFLINGAGDVLIRPDQESSGAEQNFPGPELIRSVLKNGSRSYQTIYTDEKGDEYFGAYQKLSAADAALITRIPSSIVMADTSAAVRRNILISFAVLALAICAIAFFSGTISEPLKALIRTSEMIEEGNYNISLTNRSRDEIGALTRSFIGMSHGLENFEKFTSKTLVRLARQGKLRRTGESKTVVVCFTAIRGFGELSKNMNAHDVVAFVNSFLSRIVPCISCSGGLVDKFLTQDGVVVMALWGAATTHGYPRPDALACMRSVLMMRAVLRNWNAERFPFSASRPGGKNNPLVKIGCGINIGEVISGQMGSDERMEYTVVGDTVNLAARIEGPNDLFDTDILITENMQELIGDSLVTEEMPGLEVKGKEKPLRVFSVVNMRNRQESEMILQELDRLPKTDPDLNRICVGTAGPRTTAELRAIWRADAGQPVAPVDFWRLNTRSATNRKGDAGQGR